jgi:ABC-type histidine transport system ATPase subunit
MQDGKIEEEGAPDFMFGPQASASTRAFLSQINS